MGSSDARVDDGQEPRRHLPVLGLSKSRYTAGLRCHRRLWWTVHEPDAPEHAVSPELQAIFTRGHRVGEAGRERFPGGILVDLEHWKIRERIDATDAALRAGASVVYEASFSADDVFVAVDVLHRAPDQGGWTITEVKSTVSVKGEHIVDAAVQAHVVRAAGLPVSRIEIMHLNRACRHPDLSNLFVRSDVTDRAKEFISNVPAEAARQLAMLGKDEPPEVEPSPHCFEPWECPFTGRCWPPMREHSVLSLYASKKKRAALAELGYETILDIPDDVLPPGVADRQRRAVQTGSVVVDPGLSEALAVIASPVAHLDFETIGAAIPVWPGCRPYDAVPVQFSVRLEGRSGEPTKEIGWIADDSSDPRPPLARALVDALRSAGSVVVYGRGFEGPRLRELAVAVPDLADDLLAIEARLVDVLPIVRAHVYHPAFGGSFSLKAVAPALVPGFGYDDLNVGEGGAASTALEALILDGQPKDEAERAELRRALLAYCGRDTLGTVGVLERLRRLADREV